MAKAAFLVLGEGLITAAVYVTLLLVKSDLYFDAIVHH